MQSDDLGLVDSLRAWLIKRAGPDSGIGYEGGDFDWDRLRSRQARVTLHGSDADFIAQNFHGDGAAALLAAIERLVAERDEARETAEKGLEPRIKHMRFGDGHFDMALTGEAVEAIALAFVSYFKSLGAENYVELNLFDRAEPFQRYTVTVQKVGALSPADKVTAAEAQRDKLKQALRPFAEAADSIDDTVPDRAEMWESPAAMETTAGDFRRARQALGDK